MNAKKDGRCLQLMNGRQSNYPALSDHYTPVSIVPCSVPLLSDLSSAFLASHGLWFPFFLKKIGVAI